MVFWCFCGGVVDGVWVFLWWCCRWCFGVLVVVFLRWCGGVVVLFFFCGGAVVRWCGGVFFFVVVFVWLCFCDGVFVVVFWCISCVGGGGVFVVLFSNIAQSSTEVMDVVKDCHQTSPKALLK